MTTESPQVPSSHRLLIATPARAPFILGSAADPAPHDADVVEIDITNLIDELTDEDAPLVRKTLTALGAADSGEIPGITALTVGYMSRYQQSLAKGTERTVVSSPLLALPTLLATLPDQGKVLVVYARSTMAVPEDMPGVSAEDRAERILLVGLEGPGAFRRAVIERSEPFDHDAVLDQILATIAAAQTTAKISAVVLECGEMAAVADRIRAATSIPVVDYHLVIDFFTRSMGCTRG
jgi:hypothetical protein